MGHFYNQIKISMIYSYTLLQEMWHVFPIIQDFFLEWCIPKHFITPVALVKGLILWVALLVCRKALCFCNLILCHIIILMNSHSSFFVLFVFTFSSPFSREIFKSFANNNSVSLSLQETYIIGQDHQSWILNFSKHSTHPCFTLVFNDNVLMCH